MCTRDKSCENVITHQMLEVLGLVFGLPQAYIRIRIDVLKRDYLPILTVPTVREAFLMRIGELSYEEASLQGRDVYEAVDRNARSRANCRH